MGRCVGRTMYKVLRSYSKKAERKHELTRSAGAPGEGSAGGPAVQNVTSYTNGTEDVRNGQVVPVDRNGRMEAAWASGQAFSESSSYEAREHFERKVQRVKKTRGERDSTRKSKRSKVRSSFMFTFLALSSFSAMWVPLLTSFFFQIYFGERCVQLATSEFCY